MKKNKLWLIALSLMLLASFLNLPQAAQAEGETYVNITYKVQNNSGGADYVIPISHVYYFYTSTGVSFTSNPYQFQVTDATFNGSGGCPNYSLIDYVPDIIVSNDGWVYDIIDKGTGQRKINLQEGIINYDAFHYRAFDSASLTITKQLTGDTPPANSTFTFRVSGAYVTKTVTITGAGSETINVPYGDYTITETGIPDGFTVTSTNPQSVSIAAGGSASVTFVNNYVTPPAELTVKKLLDGDPAPSGSEFTFHITGPGSYNNDITITGAGTQTLSNLTPGSYTVEETGMPAGFSPDTVSHTVTIPAGGSKTVTFTNTYTTPPGNLTIIKTLSGDAAPDGSVFHFLVTGDNYSNSVQITGAGSTTLTNLTPGTYTVQETSYPENFSVTSTNPQTIEVLTGDTVSVTFNNDYEAPAGYIEIYKSDPEDYAGCTTTDLEGAVFNIYSASDLNTVVATITTNASGYGISKALHFGNYVVIEASAPSADYQIDVTPHNVYISPGDYDKVYIDNLKKRASLTINKTASDTGAPLEGAEFTLVGPAEYTPVTGPADKTYTATTNSSGVVGFTNLPPGTYTLYESSIPSGYEVDASYPDLATTGLTIILPPGSGITRNFVNRAQDASMSITKVTGEHDLHPGAAMEGVQFGLYDAGNTLCYSATTDASGYASFSAVAAGTYILKEIVQPDSSYESTFTYNGTEYSSGMEVTLEKGVTTYHYNLSNEPKKVSIRAYKYDDRTGLPLEGAEIALYREDGPTVLYGGTALAGGLTMLDVSGTFIASAFTDANGMVEFTGLWPGTYTLREITPPDGYLNDSVPITLSLTRGGTNNFDDPAGFYNNTVDGYLVVTKTADGSGSLDGVTFELTGPNDVSGITPTTVSQVVSGGTATFTDLRPGTYTLHEVSDSANAGYDIPADQDVVIPMSTDGEPVRVDRTVDNVSLKGTIELYKRDTDVDPEGSADDPYYNVENAGFQLYSMPGEVAYGAVKYTDSTGYVKWEDVPHGDYLIKEVSAPTGYSISAEGTAGIPIALSRGETETVYVYNEKQPGTLVIHKISSYDESSLSGAVFNIYKGAYEAGMTPIATITTNSTGYASLTGLYPGEYTIFEASAPSGYQLNATAAAGITVEIEPNENETVTVANDPNPSTAIVLKVASDTSTRLRNAQFALYKGSVTVANLIGRGTTDVNGNIIFANLNPGYYIFVEEAAPAGFYAAANTSFTLGAGQTLTVRIADTRIPVVTPTPRGATPTPTPTPIPSDPVVTIEITNPPYGPATGEGTGLLITAMILLLIGTALLIIRKKLILRNVK